MRKYLYFIPWASFFVWFQTNIIGQFDLYLKSLIFFMACDYFTGITISFMQKSGKTKSGAYRSDVAVAGLIRKVFMLLVVCVGYVLERLSGFEGLRNIVICSFIINEGFSLLENVGIMGVPIPEKLKDCFELLKKEG